jgi:phospholipid/cholesterol/gamma-HCH transport system substrate-binding protein
LGKISCEFIVDYEGLNIPIDSRAKFYNVDLLGTKGISLELGDSQKNAVNGDTLISAKSPSLQESVDAQIAPLKRKAEELIGSIDSMVTIVSGVIGQNTGELDARFKSIRRAILKFESTATNLDNFFTKEQSRLSSIFSKIDNISGTLSSNSGNINNALKNLSKITDSIANADLAGTLQKAKVTHDQLRQIISGINNGEGTMGKLVQNDSLFRALVSTNDEVQRLIENIKDHPYRYLHFSLFGKRDKGVKLDARDEKKLKEMIKNYPTTTPTNTK